MRRPSRRSNRRTPIALKVDPDDVEIRSSQAVPVRLMINELLENALKHAFPDERAGTIEVRFERGVEGWLQLMVTDDGVG